MSTKISIVSVSAAAVLAVTSGVLYHRWSEAAAQHIALASSWSQELEALDREKDRLARELERSERLRRSLSRHIEFARARDAVARAEAQEKSIEVTRLASRRTGRDHPYVLGSLEEAEELSEELLAKYDIESLWLLAADLMALVNPAT